MVTEDRKHFKYIIKQNNIEDILNFKSKKLHNLRIDYAIKAIKSCPDILEVGCGNGFCLRSIVYYCNNENLKASGFDINYDFIEKAKRQWDADGRIVFTVADAEAKFPFNDKTFSAVLMLDVLEHISQVDNVISESLRVLKNGGVLFAVVPCEAERATLHAWLRKRNWNKSLKYGGHISAFQKKEIIEKFKNYGLKIKWVYYSCHFIGQLTDVIGYEIKHLTALNKERYSFFNKIWLYILKKCMKIFLQKISYYESRILSESGYCALDLNVCFLKS